MKTTTRLLLALLLLALGTSEAMAADFSHMDCASILERWATNPRSVPKRLVDECKAKSEAAVPVAPVAAAPAAADPCVGPGAASSVLCWGPWATLAPAAGPTPPASPLIAADPKEPRPEISQLYDRTPTPELPLGACVAGAACGFATVSNVVKCCTPDDQVAIKPFQLAADGTHFTVDPKGAGEINSVGNMTPVFTSDRPAPYDDLRSTGSSGDEASRIVARVVRNEDGTLSQAADLWGHGNRATNTGNSGYFAWGYAATQSALDGLNAGAVSLSFSGPMSADNRTNAQMTVNFGTQPTWTGTWTNPAWSFGAGGTVQGANLASSPSQFTSNVAAGSYVQGVLLGGAGPHGVAHAIDVTLAGQGHVRDVGLLQQVTAPLPTVLHP